MSKTKLIFVYGTLRQGGRLHDRFPDLKFVRRGYLRRYNLRTSSSYPIYPIAQKVDDREAMVIGDVIEVNEGTLKYLDMMEVNSGYRITEEKILKDPDNDKYDLLQVYVSDKHRVDNWDLLIAEGDWIKFKLNKNNN